MGTHSRTLPSAEHLPAAAAAAAAAAWSHDFLKLLSGVEYKASEVIWLVQSVWDYYHSA